MGGSAVCLKDVVFKTRWIKNSVFYPSPPNPPHARGRPPDPLYEEDKTGTLGYSLNLYNINTNISKCKSSFYHFYMEGKRASPLTLTNHCVIRYPPCPGVSPGPLI